MSPDRFAEIAGMSEQSVQSKTGRSWEEWVTLLDQLGAKELSHSEIAAQIAKRWPEIGFWWAQSVTIAYERIRGLRVEGQLSSGEFAASKSKTLPVHISKLRVQLKDSALRAAWLGSPSALRTGTSERSIRLDWPDGTRVSFWLTEKGANKCNIAVQHEKLADAERRTLEKSAWGERLNRLAATLAEDQRS